MFNRFGVSVDRRLKTASPWGKTFDALRLIAAFSPLIAIGAWPAVPVAESVPDVVLNEVVRDEAVRDEVVRDAKPLRDVPRATPASAATHQAEQARTENRAKSQTAENSALVEKMALKYEAYVAGINAGEARLTLERSTLKDAGFNSSRDYRVSGSARSKGLWESMQQWRASYSAEGHVDGVGAARNLSPGHFFSLQTTPNKRREIHIEDGVLSETKNHKVRDPRPAQRGYDLLTALFFLPPCHPEVRVHTGRDGYDMRRMVPAVAATGSGEPEPAQETLGCSYQITDDEGGRYQMSLRYSTRGNFVVPVDISVQGPLSGRMVLAD